MKILNRSLPKPNDLTLRSLARQGISKGQAASSVLSEAGNGRSAWLEENAAALHSFDEYIEREGIFGEEWRTL